MIGGRAESMTAPTTTWITVGNTRGMAGGAPGVGRWMRARLHAHCTARACMRVCMYLWFGMGDRYLSVPGPRPSTPYKTRNTGIAL